MKHASPSRRSALTRSLALAAASVTCAGAARTAAGAAGTANAVPATPAYRVVFQVSDADPAKWNLTLNNVRNAQLELGAAHTQIEIVAFGPGIGMLAAASGVAARIAEAAGAGVHAFACENTMRGQKLTREQMHPGIGYVPSGVVHLIRRQAEGYAYIRS